MAEPKENVLMEKIVSLCKRRGFVFQSSEIYGGIQGFWDYGPLGAELKRNVKELWWTSMTRQRDDVVGLEATIIMAPQIWRASGHVDTFSDPMSDCRVTGKRFRADQVEEQSGISHCFIGAFNRLILSHALAELSPPSVDPLPGLSKEASQKELMKFVEFVNAQNPTHIPLSSAFPEGLDEQIVHLVADYCIKLLKIQPDLAKSGPAVVFDNIKVLLPDESTDFKKLIKTTKAFYEKRGLLDPIVLLSARNQENDTTKYNPENGAELTDARPFNLMFKTYVGPVADEDNVAYLRPETAQAIFAQFKNVLETSRQKVPFGIAQVGKAFRNEVTPRNFTFRSREFEQMELEFFIKPDEAVEAISGGVATPASKGHPGAPQANWGWQLWHQYWVEERIKFYEGIGLPRTTLEEYWQKPDELAHYARATVDILFKFPFGTQELEGIAARSDFDLSQHERFSGKAMGVFDEDLRTAWGKLDDAKKKELSERYYQARLRYLTKSGLEPAKAEKEAKEDAEGLAKGQYIPHVIEPSAGVDRLILALIANAYSEVTSTDDKGKSETRVIMRFHPRVAPIKVGVFPLLKNKPELVAKAREVFELLRPHMMAFYDETGAIGRRYARQDEAGTPYGVTIDFETLGEKPELLNTVTVRHRGFTDEENGKQERIPISELLNWLQARVR